MGLHVDPFLPEPAEEWPGPELPEQRRLVLWNYHRHNETKKKDNNVQKLKIRLSQIGALITSLNTTYLK